MRAQVILAMGLLIRLYFTFITSFRILSLNTDTLSGMGRGLRLQHMDLGECTIQPNRRYIIRHRDQIVIAKRDGEIGEDGLGV